MATHVSAEKRIRQTARRTAVNRARLSRIRTFVKKVETAITARDKEAARAAFAAAQPELQSGALKGVLHRNTVARKLSRLSARIKAVHREARRVCHRSKRIWHVHLSVILPAAVALIYICFTRQHQHHDVVTLRRKRCADQC